MLRPLTPFVEYAINYDYFSKVLCINKEKPELGCNGQCQLIKKLEQQKKEDFQSLRILLEEYPIGFVELLDFYVTPKLPIATKTSHGGRLSNYAFLYTNSIFHPPII